MVSDMDLLDYIERLPNIHHKGATFDVMLDMERLGDQQRRVHELMLDGNWRTLRQIANETDDPEASISARLRAYRSNDYLASLFIMESERMPGEERRGVWRYRLRVRSP